MNMSKPDGVFKNSILGPEGVRFWSIRLDSILQWRESTWDIPMCTVGGDNAWIENPSYIDK